VADACAHHRRVSLREEHLILQQACDHRQAYCPLVCDHSRANYLRVNFHREASRHHQASNPQVACSWQFGPWFQPEWLGLQKGEQNLSRSQLVLADQTQGQC
jgi:hypothetical protein